MKLIRASFYLFAVLFYAFCSSYFFSSTCKGIFAKICAANYLKTTATIVESRLEEYKDSHGRSFQLPVVAYRYEVNGRDLTGERIGYGTDNLHEDYRRLVDSLPKGAVVPVFYDPAQPEQSVLQMRIPINGFEATILMFFAFFTALCLSVASDFFESPPKDGQRVYKVGPVLVQESADKVRAYLRDTSSFSGLLGWSLYGGLFCLAIEQFWPKLLDFMAVTVHGIKLGSPEILALLMWGAIIGFSLRSHIQARERRLRGVGELVIDSLRCVVEFWSIQDNCHRTVPLSQIELVSLDTERSSICTMRFTLGLRERGGRNHSLRTSSYHLGKGVENDTERERALLSWLQEKLGLSANVKKYVEHPVMPRGSSLGEGGPLPTEKTSPIPSDPSITESLLQIPPPPTPSPQECMQQLRCESGGLVNFDYRFVGLMWTVAVCYLISSEPPKPGTEPAFLVQLQANITDSAFLWILAGWVLARVCLRKLDSNVVTAIGIAVLAVPAVLGAICNRDPRPLFAIAGLVWIARSLVFPKRS